MTHYLIGMAQAAAGGGSAAPGGGLLGNPLLMMVLIFGVFYFLVIRPQSKKAKLHQQMLTELKKGDEVETQGGLIGRISGIKDDEITLQVQEGVRLRVLRSAITRPRTKPVDKTEKSEKAVEKTPDKSSEVPKDVKAS
ncbi:MAG TPA: preprotein translocase subunit YajC [Polyangia bacterium]|nr:preprotein translocase subunit YajC [Polyangia bacterium]